MDVPISWSVSARRSRTARTAESSCTQYTVCTTVYSLTSSSAPRVGGWSRVELANAMAQVEIFVSRQKRGQRIFGTASNFLFLGDLFCLDLLDRPLRLRLLFRVVMMMIDSMHGMCQPTNKMRTFIISHIFVLSTYSDQPYCTLLPLVYHKSTRTSRHCITWINKPIELTTSLSLPTRPKDQKTNTFYLTPGS